MTPGPAEASPGSGVHGAKLGTDPATGTANVDRNLLVV